MTSRRLYGGQLWSLLVGIALTLSVPLAAQEAVDTLGRCAPLGEPVSLPQLSEVNGSPNAPLAAAFAQGALLGELFPNLVRPFGQPIDSIVKVCYVVSLHGRMGPLSILMLHGFFAPPSGIHQGSRTYFALDSSTIPVLLGGEPGLPDAFHDVPSIGRLNAALVRANLTGVDTKERRLAVAALLFGPPRGGGLEYVSCRDTQRAVRVIANRDNGYRPESVIVHFNGDNTIAGVAVTPEGGGGC